MKQQENAGLLVVIIFALIFVFGFICGFLAYATKAQKDRSECEKNLPRNQQCVIKWVPEESK